MAKSKSVYVCTNCGHSNPKWQGQCPACLEWNTLEESLVSSAPSGSSSHRLSSWAGSSSKVTDLKDVKPTSYSRQSSGIGELDRVLGGGFVPGSVTLIGGDPGIGKSTLILQTLANLGMSDTVLYATGEESAEQVSLRATRLGLASANVKLIAEIELDTILAAVANTKPKFIVVDSIQTVYSGELQSAPGSVAQVRECASQLTRLAKSTGSALILIGHVTKDGSLAGPRVLEHMVDTVLYFEGEAGSAFRMLRAFKNRFGAANEMGVFNMTGKGLEEVSNPSSLFLSIHDKPVNGSVILTALEGNRPFLVEVQALVEDSISPNPRRYSSGVDLNRVQLILAVLNKHAGFSAADQNVYIKIVGGVRLTEPAADLAIYLAAYSSLRNKPLPEKFACFGEVGLAGEIRAVQDADVRVKEAIKLGYSTIMIPAASNLSSKITGASIIKVSKVSDIGSALSKI